MTEQELNDKNIRDLGWERYPNKGGWNEYRIRDEKKQINFALSISIKDICIRIPNVDLVAERDDTYNADWLKRTMQHFGIPVKGSPPSPESIQLAKAVELLEDLVQYHCLFKETEKEAKKFLAEVKGGDNA